MPLLGEQLRPYDMFRGGPFGGAPTGPIDLPYFERITGEDLAFKRLRWLINYEVVLKQWHGAEDIKRMWRAVFRGALSYDVPIPDHLVPYAKMLGVVVPAAR